VQRCRRASCGDFENGLTATATGAALRLDLVLASLYLENDRCDDAVRVLKSRGSSHTLGGLNSR
jgi:hypothetical protein